jgi:hypothetical protein
MRLNNFLRSVLKTAIYVIDSTADSVDRVSDRATRMADNARDVIHHDRNDTLHNVLAFTAGVGVGVAAGILLAPQSGAELRDSISGRVHDISDKVRGRSDTYATGTEIR